MDIKKAADLARVNLSSEELDRFSKQLADIIHHFQALQAIDVHNIEPLITPSEIDERWRDDQSKPGLPTEDALSQAPERMGQLFKVPPVI